jgi:hypothetical protein
MGPWERQNGQFIAFKFGHPHEDAVEAIEGGVTCTRDSTIQHIGIKGAFQREPPVWEERAVTAGLFATGWDGSIVVTATAAGDFNVVTEASGDMHGLRCN